MRHLSTLFVLAAFAAPIAVHAQQSDQNILTCTRSLITWQAKSGVWASSVLHYMSKPLVSNSPERAIVLKAGTKCDACSGLESAAVITDSGVFALNYGDELRAKMPRRSDYIDAKIENAGIQDLYVNFQDSSMMAAARAVANFNSEGVVVFWPQVNPDWKQNVLEVNARQNFQPIAAQNINGTAEANTVLSRVSALLKKEITTLENTLGYEYKKKKNDYDNVQNYVSSKYPEELNSENAKIAQAKTEMVPLQRDFDEITAELRANHNSVITRALESQSLQLQMQIGELKQKIDQSQRMITSNETFKNQAVQRLAVLKTEMDAEKTTSDDLLKDFHANGLAGCAK